MRNSRIINCHGLIIEQSLYVVVIADCRFVKKSQTDGWLKYTSHPLILTKTSAILFLNFSTNHLIPKTLS